MEGVKRFSFFNACGIVRENYKETLVMNDHMNDPEEYELSSQGGI